MLAGLALGTVGCAVLTASTFAHSYTVTTAVGFVFFGAGFALVMPAMTAVVVASAPPGQTGIASAVLSATRQAGGTFGVALLGTILGSAASRHALRLDLALVGTAFGMCWIATALTVGSRDAGTRQTDEHFIGAEHFA